MTDSGSEVLRILGQIRDLLVPISGCFEEQFVEIQRQRLGARLKEFEALLTPVRRRIYPLLFDPRSLTQAQIAEEVNTTQPTVSRFILMLLEHDFIELGEAGSYKDKYDLRKLVETKRDNTVFAEKEGQGTWQS